jgi:hypothetical protein
LLIREVQTVQIQLCESYKMKFVTVGIITLLTKLVSSQYMMQVNYYEGQQCGDGYINSLNVASGDDGVCLSYNIPGAGSFNIANCWEKPMQIGPDLQYWYETCYCLFFTGDGCTGNNAAYVGMDSNNQPLADNNCGTTGQTLQEPVSIKCWWGNAYN